MVGEKLHKFDLQLCDYAMDTVLGSFDQPRFAAWVRSQVSPELLRYSNAKEDSAERLLLTDDDLADLAEVAHGPPEEWSSSRWVPYSELHRRAIYCVKEIRTELTRQIAEEWSRTCGRFTKQLGSDGLFLPDGVKIVREWIGHVRRLLRAMGALHYLPYPEGTFPTPATPTPPVALAGSGGRMPNRRDMEDIERMRGAIAKGVKGRNTMPDTLIKAAKINKQRGRKALRWLQQEGEYAGFRREQAARYKQGRPNET